MTKLFGLFLLALASFGYGLILQAIGRDGCPFVCRVDANGIRGAWYETQLPGFQKTLWVSREQKALQGEVRQ